MSWGGDCSLDEGGSIGREAAAVTMEVIIPVHLADKISIDADGKEIRVATPSDLFTMGKSLEFIAKTAGCGPRLVNAKKNP